MIIVSELTSVGLGLATFEEIKTYSQVPMDPDIAMFDPPAGKCIDPITFLAYLIPDHRIIGTSILYNHMPSFYSIEFGIRIWNKEDWNKGYGSEITFMTCDYAFRVMGIDTVVLKVVPNNHRAIRCYSMVGFVYNRTQMIDGTEFSIMYKQRG